jgi:hypothetical protein
MDVVTAFLNGTLDVEIYTEQPPGFTQKGKEHLVCRFKKSLYGLKQSPKVLKQKVQSVHNSGRGDQIPVSLSILRAQKCPSLLSTFMI